LGSAGAEPATFCVALQRQHRCCCLNCANRVQGS
jgi:hypothetical protein